MSEPDGIAVPSSRELLDDWLAVLTLMGERDATASSAAEAFTRSIGRHSFDISLESRITRRDHEQLAAFTAAIGEMFNRQATVHWLVEERLIAVLGEATGDSRAEIIQQLALDFSESAEDGIEDGSDDGSDDGSADGSDGGSDGGSADGSDDSSGTDGVG